jgi:PAS domain S-box-containing protein
MPNILIIDDDATSRRLYVSLLAPCGYRVVQARDGQEGLSIAQAENPDLVICDIVMPTINGYEFVQQLRSLPQHQRTPVIFHSVNLMDQEARALGSACGISRFILKPFNPQQALATIQEALNSDHLDAPAAVPSVAKRDPIPLLLNAYFVKGKKLDASVQLASLVDVGIALAHAQQTTQLLEIAMTAARKLTDARFAAAGILAESDSLETQTLALSGFDETTAAQLRQRPFSPAFLREVLAERQPRRIFNPPEESLALLLPPPHPKVCSILAVPLESGDRAHGWMMIAEKADSQAFTNEDERMLQALASQTITSYQSAQRLRTIQERAKDLEHQIEERKRAENRFRMLLETSPTGIVISNGTGRIEDVNAEALRLFGYTREELVGQMIEILVPHRLQRAHEGHRADYAHDLRTRPMRTGTELSGRRKDGTEFPAEIGLGPLATRDGILISSMIVDITARKKMEEQLRLSQRMDAIGRLAGGVAHDFNNLLTVILGNSDVVLDSLPAGHPAIQKLETIRSAGVSAAGLTRQLLAFGRQQLVQPRILDLKDTLQKMEVLLRRLIGANIELKISLDPSLGTIKADPGQIEQILLNLAVNARDAMPEGGCLTIEASNVEIDESYREQHPVAMQGRYVMLAVTDTGCGMDRETQLRIFEPFFTTKELGKGTGLGLATVYGIVKQGGGYIWVYSEIAQGSVFKVYLPRLEQLAQPPKREEEQETCNGGEVILLAEDSDPLREMAREYLESAGYTVIEAVSGKDALQRAKEFAGTIHVLLTDVVMPEMNGPELASQLTLLRPGIKVIFTSGYTDDAVARQGILDSTVAFVQKPYRPKALARKIREVLRGAPDNAAVPESQLAQDSQGPQTLQSG